MLDCEHGQLEDVYDIALERDVNDVIDYEYDPIGNGDKFNGNFVKRPCPGARVWLAYQPDMDTAWKTCERLDWMVWAISLAVDEVLPNVDVEILIYQFRTEFHLYSDRHFFLEILYLDPKPEYFVWLREHFHPNWK